METLPNTWKRRQTVKLTCPKGSVCLARRPGPELALRLARIQRTLKPLADVAQSAPEKQAEALAKMSEEETRATLELARQTVVATVVEPKLYLEPDPNDETQIGVDDIEPDDFWWIFAWAANGARDAPVQTQEGETTVAAVENFSESEGAGARLGGDVRDLRAESGAQAGA